MKRDLIPLAIKKCHTCPAEFFRAWCEWSSQHLLPHEVHLAFKEWSVTKDDPSWSDMQDFALDILANRIPMYIDFIHPVRDLSVRFWLIRPAAMLQKKEMWPESEKPLTWEDNNREDSDEQEV